MKALLTLFTAFTMAAVASAQSIENPVTWKMELENTDDAGVKNVKLSADVKPNWQLYSSDFDPNLGPMVTEFKYTVHPDFELVGPTYPKDSKRKYDDLWGGEYSYFEKHGEFNQKVKTTSEKPSIEVQITYQVCNTLDGKCIPYDITLNVNY